MSNRLYACIYINRFLVTMARRLNPALAGAPVIISGNLKQHGQVIELSPEALTLGLCTGMATWEALHRCPRPSWRKIPPALPGPYPCAWPISWTSTAPRWSRPA